MAQHVSGQHLQIFEGRKVRTVWDESAQEWYFSVADVVSVLTDSSDVKQYIKKMRTRDPELGARWGTICTPTRMMAEESASQLSKERNPEGFVANATVAKDGAEVAKIARDDFEKRLGRSVISSERAIG